MKDALKIIVTIFLMLTFIPLSAFLFVDNSYGKFEIYDENKQKIIALSQREYVVGALCCEMPPTFHKEALKAQAVAIYTNAVRSTYSGENKAIRVDQENFKGYASKQRLKEKWGKNFTIYYEKMCAAVDEVLGSVIVYNGKPILAAYHSMSPGKTENSENVWGKKVPYLVSVESEGDTFCADLQQKKTVSVGSAREILSKTFPKAFLPEVDTLLFTDIKTSPSGTVLSLMVGDVEVTGQKIRELFSLRSAAFSFEIGNGNITFTTKGYGHGVGLSQYGADFMARQGADYKEILKHYYTSSSILYMKQE